MLQQLMGGGGGGGKKVPDETKERQKSNKANGQNKEAKH